MKKVPDYQKKKLTEGNTPTDPEKYPYNVVCTVGGPGGSTIIIDDRNIDRQEIERLDKESNEVGLDLLKEINTVLGMIMLSNENLFILFSNKELSEEEIEDVWYESFWGDGYEVLNESPRPPVHL